MKKFILRTRNLLYLALLMFKAFKNSAPPPRHRFKDFMYTPADKMLFWVAGYTGDNNTDSLADKLKYLATDAQAFANKVGCPISEVKTYYNPNPPRYQYMRVYYIETETPHPEAFVFQNPNYEWTMHRVLTN